MRMLEACAIEHGVGLDDLWLWTQERLKQALPWSSTVLDHVEIYRHQLGEAPDLSVPGDAVLPFDPIWPKGLDDIDRPPMHLFCRGRNELLACLDQRQVVAVVGTRSASRHGLQMADELGRSLAQAGWPVLSGLAEGIDAAAHHGCLAVGGAPVAVLGTPLDRVYPRHHEQLQRRVAENGLVLSEYPSGSSVQRGHFAARNRLLVACASTVVVVECPERSGALITARLAAKRGCSLWAAPGDARRWTARGSNALLGGIATPLNSVESLLGHLGQGPLPLKPSASETITTVDAPLGLRHPQCCDQLAVISALGDGASLEDLAHGLGWPTGTVAQCLLQLELDNKVVCESGLQWRAVEG
tara:strand:+ start:1690 stop:2760 length:1071 start_codon:yes stop_codon:yes gene_type:complete